MKLTCTQENFRRAVYNTERVTGRQAALPILNNILIETDRGRLKLSATNLEIGAIAKIGAKIEREGKITIPAKILSNFINNLPAQDTIELEEKKQTLSIRSGNYQAAIRGLDSQEFPIIPRMEGESLFTLSAQELRETIARLLVCITPNETRPELSGINATFSASGVTLAATDSFRLVEAFLPLPPSEQTASYPALVAAGRSIIIPATTLSEVLRIISPETQKVKVAIEESQIFFDVDNVQVVSRLINGKYPEYKQIIPREFATRAVLPREDLLRAVKVASIFSKNIASGEVTVKADPEKKELAIFSQSQETGENRTKLKADITGPAQEAVFNPRYLLDGIGAIPTVQLAFLFTSNVSPAAFKMIKNDTGEVQDGLIYIVMPIKN